MSTTVTRFAPSPTGRLHLGHAYAAKMAHDRARSDGGKFLLRFEDIDHTRVRPEFYGLIEEDLRWLGLEWDGEAMRQSDRAGCYSAATERLRASGVVYPCFCTRRGIEEEIARMASAPQGPEGALYPGTCRRLSAGEREARLLAGARPAWRLDAAMAARRTGPLSFADRRHGPQAVDPSLLGDVVLARNDIGCSYHLAVVVDDAFQQITLVTRGDDLLPSTHVHRLLQQLLGLPEPEYLHHRVVTDVNGARLAKRHDALSIQSLRKQGWSARDVLKRAGAV